MCNKLVLLALSGLTLFAALPVVPAKDQAVLLKSSELVRSLADSMPEEIGSQTNCSGGLTWWESQDSSKKLIFS